MPFLVRSVEANDLPALYDLARQAPLFHLPADKNHIKQLIYTSVQSFQKNTPPADAVYLFIIEDVDKKKVVGTSQIIANYASAKAPYYYFQVSEKKFRDKELRISKNQRFLKLKKTTQELSTIGGVVIDRDYRGSPEKIGKQIIQTRLIYMGMFPNRFKDKILSELVAPVTENGENLFWKNIGERFTELSSKQADQLEKQKKMEFIYNLIPKDKIYLSLLDENIIPSINRVEFKHGKTAQHIIEKMGFRYLHKVHVQGCLLYGAQLDQIPLVRNLKALKVKRKTSISTNHTKYMGVMKNGSFLGGKYPCQIEKEYVHLSPNVANLMELNNGDILHLSQLD